MFVASSADRGAVGPEGTRVEPAAAYVGQRIFLRRRSLPAVLFTGQGPTARRLAICQDAAGVIGPVADLRDPPFYDPCLPLQSIPFGLLDSGLRKPYLYHIDEQRGHGLEDRPQGMPIFVRHLPTKGPAVRPEPTPMLVSDANCGESSVGRGLGRFTGGHISPASGRPTVAKATGIGPVGADGDKTFLVR